jgi:hypothetical protein
VQVFSGWIEIEQRIWMRLQWTRQFASLDAHGQLQISSSALYDKRLYLISGAQAVLIGDVGLDGNTPTLPISILIRLDRSRQYGDESEVTFRLCDAVDAEPWIAALARSTPSSKIVYSKLHASRSP